MRPLPTGTVTFLFTDIEKSTRLLAHDVSVMRDALIAHHDAIRTAVERHGGIVFETVGDAVYAAFADPRNALAAAVDGQLALRRDVPTGVGPLRARMVVHSGAVELRDAQHYVGEPLIRCARILVLGHGAQTLVSGAAAALASNALPAGASLRDLGEHRLKDLEVRERIYQLDHPDLPSTFPALRSLDARPNNLPAQLSSFVGRERELAELQTLLTQYRLLTLTGAGGVGKTRLALRLAQDVLDHIADGVFFVELAPVADPALVWPTLGAALGVRGHIAADERAAEPVRVAVVDYLRDRAVLLVLDNCEHLVDATAAAAEELLRSATALRVIATTREALGVAGERIWRVPSLSEAEELFRQRARALVPSFTPRDGDGARITRICERVDRIPLAVELAAARVKVLSLDEIGERLDDRFRLLTGGSRTVTARQQTLRATVDWSYDLLGEEERALWRRLSVFAGGFTLDAAEAVCGGDDVAAERVLDGVSQLVDKSLVVAEVPSNGAMRHRLLETLREYAGQRLVDAGEADGVRRRHAEHYIALAERARPHLLGGAEQPAWFDRLETELDNLRAALRWSIDHDRVAAVRVGLALGRFVMVRGHVADGVLWRDGALPPPAGLAPNVRGEALELGGVISQWTDEYERARTSHDAALAIFREIEDESGQISALASLGNVASAQGEDLVAQRYYEDALAIELQRRDASGRNRSDLQRGLGRLAWRRGDYRRARELYEEAVAIRRNVDDRLGVARALQDLAYVHLDQEDAAGAEQIGEEALALCRELGLRSGVVNALNALGAVAQYRGDWTGAAAYGGEAIAIARDLGIAPLLGIALLSLAECAIGQAEHEQAGVLAAEAVDILGRIDSNRGVTWCWDLAGRVALFSGDLERGARLFAAMTEMRRRLRLVAPPWSQRRVDAHIAELRTALGAERFAGVWAEGAAMTREQANTYAAETLGAYRS